MPCPGKTVWPELLGSPGITAESTIEMENGCVNAIIVRQGIMVPRDFRCGRVWVWVNVHGVVVHPPQVG